MKFVSIFNYFVTCGKKSWQKIDILNSYKLCSTEDPVAKTASIICPRLVYNFLPPLWRRSFSGRGWGK